MDASAAVSALLAPGTARDLLDAEQIHVPHVIDAEVPNALRRLVAAGAVRPTIAGRLLDTWSRLGVTRYGTFTLLDRVWRLRDNLSAYDASYVVLAESLHCALVTADARLSSATGPRCPITVVPR